MKFNAGEIASVIKTEIEGFRGQIQSSEVGRVVEVGDGIARVYGLATAMAGEMVEFTRSGVRGQVFNLEENSVGVIILGDYLKITEGEEVRTTGSLLSIPVGDELIGRVVDPLGNPLDGKGPVLSTHTRPLETTAPGVAGRQPVKQPLQTGIKAVDAMTPVGRGQRELIIGDRKTGKTAVAVDAIINQKGGDVICVYVSCGQRASSTAGVVEALTKAGAMDYTIVVSASASDPAPLQYIAPYAGASIAEYFMYQGKHTLVVYDDLTRQATAYRQLSLLMRRPPGREAYPGDVFYCHSRLLERAAKLSDELGGGSMTALPIIETLEGEVSAYIPTNVISITLGTELDKATQQQLDRGYRMVELLKQPQFRPLNMADQVMSIYGGSKGYFDKVPVPRVQEAEQNMIQFMREEKSEVRDALIKGGVLDDATEGALKKALEEWRDRWQATESKAAEKK